VHAAAVNARRGLSSQAEKDSRSAEGAALPREERTIDATKRAVLAVQAIMGNEKDRADDMAWTSVSARMDAAGIMGCCNHENAR
jgi:hypothetical protein